MVDKLHVSQPSPVSADTDTAGVLIETQAISLRLQDRPILEHVDLRVHKGEIVTLIGPNGAGKSTLVRIILGLQKPDSGRIHVQAGIRIGYMPQRLTIDPTMPLTVRRFLTLAQRASVARLRTVLDEVGAGHLLDAPMQTLSGGETQRVLLARAMLRNPELLILDEPLQGVDVAGQEELYRLISAIRRRYGCGILMISHDLHMVMAATDQVFCLNRHVCCSGHPDSVRTDPNYTSLFGLPGGPEVMTGYSHQHDHGHDMHGDVIADDHEEHGHG
jgi:zinc transport system ATP-binding protein